MDENAQVKSETFEVLDKWKSDYEHMFNGNNNELFDQERLEEIVSLVQNPESNVFPKADCSSLNSPITLEEVKSSVYNANSGKQQVSIIFPLTYCVMSIV